MTESTGDFFAEFTESYAQVMSAIPGYQQLLTIHADAMNGLDPVLDSCSGPGLLALELLRRGHTVTGFDQNEVGIRRLERLAAAEGYKSNLTVGVGDAQHLPYKDGQFAGISSMLALMFMEDPKQYLQEHHRVLQKGGKIVISGSDPAGRDDVLTVLAKWETVTQSSEKMREHWERFKRYTAQNAAANVRHWFTIPTLEALLEETGFRVLKSQVNPVYMGRGYIITAQKEA